jgi:hypothetical protein
VNERSMEEKISQDGSNVLIALGSAVRILALNVNVDEGEI